jgi:HAD superfamily hydrolase (TIGR01549 family)
MKKRSRVKRFARFVLRGGRRRKGAAGLLKKSPRFVVFDFDGTLADTFIDGFEILNILAEEFDFKKLSREELDHARDWSTRELMKKLGIPRMKLHRIAKRGTEEMTGRIPAIQPCTGMLEVVHQLHSQGYRLGILTSNSAVNVTAFLKQNDLEIFDFIKSSSKLLGKSAVIRDLLKEYKLHPTDIFFVGDEMRDIEAAQETGIHMAAVTWGYNSHSAIQAMSPDYLFHHPTDLVHLLQQISNTPESL